MREWIDPEDVEHENDVEIISKSQLKRDAHALVAIGEQLVALSASKLATIPLPDELHTAIQQAHKITARGASKRQRLYIGKLMRSLDPEPIIVALDKLAQQGAESTALHHRLETWRDRLLTEGDLALSALLEEYPMVDRQHLRQLIRNALKEQEKHRPVKSAREIFRYLRDLNK